MNLTPEDKQEVEDFKTAIGGFAGLSVSDKIQAFQTVALIIIKNKLGRKLH